jgi:hypothetical protein
VAAPVAPTNAAVAQEGIIAYLRGVSGTTVTLLTNGGPVGPGTIDISNLATIAGGLVKLVETTGSRTWLLSAGQVIGVSSI